ncbi:uncharacterized protein LOC102495565 [Tupaia chinensis]|uniref:uncharacterized protein LOC102495565 n=1 Tax=Tupaia chinensis TaxID=246437 RepID=UPI0003C90B82|nr:uncharacterized protein LOC102495565 [Tupaia chinensis]
MGEFLLKTKSSSEVTHFFFKLVGVFFSFLTWTFGIGLANSRSWRVWEFHSETVPVMFLGLWEAFYFQKFNISGSAVELPVQSSINESWVIPDEIRYGQDLMLLANLLKSVVLVCSSLAILVTWVRAPYPHFLRTCYNLSAFFLCLGSGCTVGTVSWNVIVDFHGETTLEFPLSFPIDKDVLKKKHLSYVLPLGILTGSMSLMSAGIFLYQTDYLVKLNQVKPMMEAKLVSLAVTASPSSLTGLPNE